ncbi:MAG TPA: hypothetical protein DCP60_03090 [Psychrobacter sp.]|jgi:hypothetical protein|nr:hypothetical protein [Psychrobacter sp.]
MSLLLAVANRQNAIAKLIKCSVNKNWPYYIILFLATLSASLITCDQMRIKGQIKGQIKEQED